MAKPVILAVDDDPQVLRAVERDLRRRYAREYRYFGRTPGNRRSTLWASSSLEATPWRSFWSTSGCRR